MIRTLRSWLDPRHPEEYRLGLLRQYAPRPLAPPPRVPPPPEETPPLRFCIITPSYQQGRFLESTLLSLLGQDYPRLDYGVQDGGSTDATAEVLGRHRHRLAFAVSAPDAGQADAIIRGFQALQPAPGDILAWLNADDLCLPGTLARVSHAFQTHPDIGAIYGHRLIIDEDGSEIGRWLLPDPDPEALRWVDFIPQETLFIRASAYQQCGGLDPSFHYALDWDLLLRLQDSGCRFLRLPFFLGAFRVHERQKTSADLATNGLKEMARLRERSLRGRFNDRRFERVFWREVRRSRRVPHPA